MPNLNPSHPPPKSPRAGKDFRDHLQAKYFIWVWLCFVSELLSIHRRVVLVTYQPLIAIRWLFRSSFILFFKNSVIIIFWGFLLGKF